MAQKSERVAKALENHKKGYNCAQAVACAYADLFGVDEKTAFRMTEGFLLFVRRVLWCDLSRAVWCVFRRAFCLSRRPDFVFSRV